MITVLSLWHGQLAVRPMIADIVEDVAYAYAVSVDDLIGPSKARHLAVARQAAFARCRARGKTCTQIGRYFHRDHSTVSYGAQAHELRAQQTLAAVGGTAGG